MTSASVVCTHEKLLKQGKRETGVRTALEKQAPLGASGPSLSVANDGGAGEQNRAAPSSAFSENPAGRRLASLRAGPAGGQASRRRTDPH